jgi:hypothetical protein
MDSVEKTVESTVVETVVILSRKDSEESQTGMSVYLEILRRLRDSG